jgi:hypothetical protein
MAAMEDIDPRSASVQTIPSTTADWDEDACVAVIC